MQVQAYIRAVLVEVKLSQPRQGTSSTEARPRQLDALFS
jgi:hypothetical protein